MLSGDFGFLLWMRVPTIITSIVQVEPFKLYDIFSAICTSAPTTLPYHYSLSAHAYHAYHRRRARLLTAIITQKQTMRGPYVTAGAWASFAFVFILVGDE
jgi:hypothetical protein